MNHVEVQIPLKGPTHKVDLFFEHDYGNGSRPFDYIQMIRSRALFAHGEGSRIEREYWNGLEAGRRQFAKDVREALGEIDMIIDPPSRNALHRPYLAALLDAYPDVPWLYSLKNGDVQSVFENLAKLREVITPPRQGDRKFPKKKLEIGRVLVVDDAFSEGNIASVVIEKLIEFGIPPQARFFIAVPLRAHG